MDYQLITNSYCTRYCAFTFRIQSLMTGLMYYRPDDHLGYINECLTKIKNDGLQSIKWNMFIEQARKTPLPPIGQNGRRVSGAGMKRGKIPFMNPMLGLHLISNKIKIKY